ncbi:site-specific integrase [Acaricomes phytoseiuli]|uniref:tyrosine-type recombinase/integrase n=1 Tax=Acaricomes phytoseiuli TaxID=291968 RepID=UPI00222184C3|nr:site-specific integrase [Acaricomes phytoseiuli]MCW1249967.1 site-specific integrase [Acaricomes phytoseiuli]
MASIRERFRKDGSITYTVLWRDPYTRKQESYATSEQEVARLIKRLLDENGQDWEATERLIDQTAATGPTLIEAVEEHIKMNARASSGTRGAYKRYVEQHLSPFFQRRKLSAIGYRDISQWVQWMSGKKLAPKSIANVHGLLSSAMKTAMRLGYIDTNPCEGITLPRTESAEEGLNMLTHEEFEVFIGSLDEHFHPFARFLVGTGLRFSEATALTSEHFTLDTDPALVSVKRAWKEDEKRRPYLGPPKSRRSRRAVSMDDETAKIVRPLVERADGRLDFTMKRGGPIRTGNLYADYWTPAAAAAVKAGLRKRPSVHDLRHTHASWMIDAGMDLYELSRRLGHESIKTTESVYLHLMPAAHRRGAEIAARAIRGEDTF